MSRLLMIRFSFAAGASLLVHLVVFAAVGPSASPSRMAGSGAEIHIGPPPGSHAPSGPHEATSDAEPVSMRELVVTAEESAPEPEPPEQDLPKLHPAAGRLKEASPSPAQSTESPPPDPSARPDGAEASAATPSRSLDEGAGTPGDSDASAPAEPGPSGSAAADQSASAPGNADAANYAGLVMLHLSKVRRPRASSPGSAFVSFTIGNQGELEDIRISISSRSARFDRDALAVVRRAAPFPPPPPGVNRSFSVEIEGA